MDALRLKEYNAVISSIRAWLVRNSLFESAVLATLFGIAGSIWGFVELADLVVEGESRKFDECILLAFRDPLDLAVPIGPRWMVEFARDLTSLGGISVITLVCLIVLGFLALRRKWGAFCLLLASVLGGGLVSFLLKIFFHRPRPSVVPHLAVVQSLSFPSGHSMLSAVTYITLGALLARTSADRALKAYCLAVAIFLALLVGITRLYLGVHYPTDVLAGWCAGTAWALVCTTMARWLQNSGAIEQESQR